MKKCIRTYGDELKSASRRGRYPGEENYHVTLAFIGEFNDLGKVKRALEKVVFEPFEISAGGVGSFGSIYYVKVKSEERMLDLLAEKVRGELEAAGVPFDCKRFKAHITIGRDVECDVPVRCFETASMEVSEISLMKSDFIGGKRLYKSLFSVDARK